VCRDPVELKAPLDQVEVRDQQDHPGKRDRWELLDCKEQQETRGMLGQQDLRETPGHLVVRELQALQVAPVRPDRPEILDLPDLWDLQEFRVRMDCQELRAVRVALERQALLDQMAILELKAIPDLPDLQDRLVRLDRLDLVARREMQAHLETLVRQGSLARLEIQEHQATKDR